jgi:hypothetical protein
MFDVVRFWLNRGASAFRLDATPYLVEDPAFPGDPHPQQPGGADSLEPYNSGRPENHDVLRNLRKILDGYRGDPVLLEESSTATMALELTQRPFVLRRRNRNGNNACRAAELSADEFETPPCGQFGESGRLRFRPKDEDRGSGVSCLEHEPEGTGRYHSRNARRLAELPQSAAGEPAGQSSVIGKLYHCSLRSIDSYGTAVLCTSLRLKK